MIKIVEMSNLTKTPAALRPGKAVSTTGWTSGVCSRTADNQRAQVDAAAVDRGAVADLFQEAGQSRLLQAAVVGPLVVGKANVVLRRRAGIVSSAPRGLRAKLTWPSTSPSNESDRISRVLVLATSRTGPIVRPSARANVVFKPI